MPETPSDTQSPVRFAAVLVMAGRGERFGGGLPKVFFDLVGKPVWRHAAETLRGTPGCERLVLVTSADRVMQVTAEVKEAGLADTIVIAGGVRRQDSVRAGLSGVPDRIPVVAVHDAARPLVREEIVLRVVQAAHDGGAAIAGRPVRDTLKRVNPTRRIEGTEERDGLWLAETPQAFHTVLLRKAHEEALAAGTEVSDDACLIEQTGGFVQVVETRGWNAKITVPTDLEMVVRFLTAKLTIIND